MPSVDCDLQLCGSVFDGDFDAVKAALEAGANVNGHPDQPFPTIVGATMRHDAVVVELLLEPGEDPDRPVVEETPCPETGISAALLGERALHLAGRGGSVEIVRLLVERSRDDPNATDRRGCTPLSAACECQLSVCLRGSGAVAAGCGRRPGLGRNKRVQCSARRGPQGPHGLGRHAVLQGPRDA